MVPHNTVIVPTAQLEKNVIKVATKQHKDKLYFKRESIDTSNIIEGKRGTRNNKNIVTQNVQHHQPDSEIEKLKNRKIQFLRSIIIMFYHQYGIILLFIIIQTLI
jgi:hypothetical protein